jgi:hypothetical protein
MKKIFLTLCLAVVMAVMAFAAPADGTWHMNTSTANAPFALVLQVSGSTLRGTADGVTISNGSVSGNAIFFQVAANGTTIQYKGTITNNQLSLYQGGTYNRSLAYTHQ